MHLLGSNAAGFWGKKRMKGIILAGGAGTRLYPITQVVCKQLLPIYDKPMIYYPLSVLMLAGIRDILIISTPSDIDRFVNMLGNGSHLGISISYAEQKAPNGLAEAFIIGEKFIGNDRVCLILGDNIFFGHDLPRTFQNAVALQSGATIFGYYVNDPARYGVIEFDQNHKVLSIEEKPKVPKSNYAAVGIYFYDDKVVRIAKELKPSQRGELEITDLNNKYRLLGELNVELLGRGFAWLDTGTFESLLDASYFVKTIEARQGFKIACVEEIAFSMGYIGEDDLFALAQPLKKSGYGEYLLNVLSEKKR
jgi:glucose-1-phosphate thymidylyltransferase